MFCAIAALEPSALTPTAAIQRADFSMQFLPYDMPGFLVLPCWSE
jgi:hypothetical protein